MQQCLPAPPPPANPIAIPKGKPHTYLRPRIAKARHPTPASPSPHLDPPTPAPTIPSPPPARFLPPRTIHLCTHLPPTARDPPLLNLIHPLFSPGAFPSLSPEAYALLMPALRLASHLLLCTRSLRWWCTTLLSPAPKPPTTSPPTLRPVSPTPHHLALAALALRTHASHLTFHFQPLTGGYGFTYRDHGGRVRIALSASFLDFLRRGVVPLAQRLRFRLLLAVSVLHEVAHGLWMLRVGSEGGGFRGGGAEPLHGLGEVEAELGRSWERGVFGGRIQSVGFGVGCEEGLVWVGSERGEERMGNFWGVGMGWVGGICGGRGGEEEERMLVGEGVRVPFSEEGWVRRGVQALVWNG